MKWILGLGGTGLIIAIAAFAIMNPAAALKLWSSVSGFVQDKLRDVFEWARNPDRNWWKIGFFSAASFCLLASFYANDRRKEVLFVTSTLTEQINTCKVQAVEVEKKATINYENLLACQTELKKVVGEDQETDALNAQAVAEAKAAQRAAERELVQWKARKKTIGCSDALKVLETQCAAFSDF